MSNNRKIIADNVAIIKERICRAAEKAGRSIDDIELMAVTKFQPIDVIQQAYLAGIRLFGENRVQEALAKYPLLEPDLEGAFLHMIGTVQKNKINKALTIFDAIQGIDNIETLEAILARIKASEKPIKLYLELHTGEISKAGFPNVDELLRGCEVYAEFLQSDHQGARKASLCGLMTMAPFTQDVSLIRRSFKMLSAARDKVKSSFDFPEFGELSMGMSNDFEIAIEEGSTLVRIGTAIFGERKA
ncbi:MAG TPA: YggS family pyridoxal phosphate-dependent enzyme [Rectinema sp.]|jgi:pyridoxal phosphate enzyme (YggS family)|nr:YggS family pyridoxal phosphate-dependent enzyme [Rectinema sp.]HOR49205.1 YggS family pyridoxal phosphate-dependent enzyme [Rectinema sp.]HRR38895.1 YggS family pyridoxal phosphate-dependent enzyme [Rectinema sp.]